jgi:hypothetical protein
MGCSIMDKDVHRDRRDGGVDAVDAHWLAASAPSH